MITIRSVAPKIDKARILEIGGRPTKDNDPIDNQTPVSDRSGFEDVELSPHKPDPRFIEYPTGGKEAIATALEILKGNKVPKEIILPSEVFTKK
jgi:hypothetical protein